jgi:DNA polymerase-4
MVSSTLGRKIIHVDMDAFYASVEQRDNPKLRGIPVAVGYADKRGVIATASYEARKFGVHSAMPSITAKKLCPQLIIVPPRFEAYRTVSRQIHAIFKDYTDLIEPVSLDEAYLDVTTNKRRIRSAWTTAQVIRDRILEETGLTASAGVSYNKFLAKAASDLRKPNGQYLILPEQGQAFIEKLAIGKFHGIGPKTTERMHKLGIETGADLKKWSLESLQEGFGKVGIWYYHIARAEDDRNVESERERKSVSAETTFQEDTTNTDQLEDSVMTLASEIGEWAEKAKEYGRTVTVKIKWADFEQSTRSRTVKERIADVQELRQVAVDLLRYVFPLKKGIRLVGVGMSNFKVTEPKPTKQTILNFED